MPTNELCSNLRGSPIFRFVSIATSPNMSTYMQIGYSEPVLQARGLRFGDTYELQFYEDKVNQHRNQ